MSLSTTAKATERPTGVSTSAWLALALAIVVGSVLRLAWLEDIEYKGDEEWTYRHAMAAGRTEPLSWLGMPTSAGPENPGMSLWAFIPLRWLGETPVDMARGVALLSIASMAATVLFAWKMLPGLEREIWFWAVALEAVHPLSVVHHRKIWPPCLFPLLFALFLACWWRRERRPAAFGWGAVGAILGQIHLSAAFFAIAFAAWTRLTERSRTAWKSWFAGSALASLPAIPWLWHLMAGSTRPSQTTLKLGRILEGKYYLRWFTEPFGLGLDHGLGEDYFDFLSQPVVLGAATWFVAALHAAAMCIAAAIVWRWMRNQPRSQWRAAVWQCDPPTAQVCNAAFWGYGLMLTLSCLPLHRQYMIVVYLLQLVWVAFTALSIANGNAELLRCSRRLLAGLVVVELLLSASFLGYVHEKQVIDGDYGTTFAAQQRQEAALTRSTEKSANR